MLAVIRVQSLATHTSLTDWLAGSLAGLAGWLVLPGHNANGYKGANPECIEVYRPGWQAGLLGCENSADHNADGDKSAELGPLRLGWLAGWLVGWQA